MATPPRWRGCLAARRRISSTCRSLRPSHPGRSRRRRFSRPDRRLARSDRNRPAARLASFRASRRPDSSAVLLTHAPLPFAPALHGVLVRAILATPLNSAPRASLWIPDVLASLGARGGCRSSEAERLRSKLGGRSSVRRSLKPRAGKGRRYSDVSPHSTMYGGFLLVMCFSCIMSDVPCERQAGSQP